MTETKNYSEITRKLNDALGSTLIAVACGDRNPKAPMEWERNDVSISDGTKESLEFIDFIWDSICEVEGPDTTRAWFIGMNPTLGDTAPILAIREGRREDVKAASYNMVNDVWEG